MSQPSPTRSTSSSSRRRRRICADMVEGLAPHLRPTPDLLSVVKGLESGTLLRMSEVIAEAAGVPIGRIAALSGPEPRRRGRAQPAGLRGRRRRRSGTRRAGRGAARPARVPALRQRGHPRRRAVRGAQERRGDRGRRRRRPRLRRQRQGRAPDPRPGRDDPARDRGRRQPADLRRAWPGWAT